ncbi:MAG TPA: T9SS type A sorting domain-containing protein [Crocinitomix sp.]|nr:T9SS type A sorting domain-containing protein [Crocinitomix sp.]
MFNHFFLSFKIKLYIYCLFKNPKMSKTVYSIIIAIAILSSTYSLAQPQLWGTTNSGGSILAGTIFNLDTAGNNYQLQYDWISLSDGKKPHTGLLHATNDMLYGVTYQDGPFFGGVLFEFNYVTGTYTHLHDFQDPTGSLPIGPVIESTNGKLYGITTFGGALNYGVIYSYDLNTNIYSSLVDFDNTILGSGPHGRLLEAPNGKMYGLSGHGGANGFGTLFEFDPVTNICITRIDLDSVSNGYHPEGSLVFAPNGKMYALSSFGGVNNKGLLFEYDYLTNTTTKLVDFNGANGAHAYGDVFVASNGKLYGMTYEGGNNNSGVIFEYDITTSTYTVKYHFDGGVNGANPKGNFMESSNGKLYAYNSYGGAYNKGVIIEYDFVNDVVTKKLDFDGTNGVFNSQNFFIELCAKPTIFISQSIDTLCLGDSVLIDATGSATTYMWDNGVSDSVWFIPNTVGLNTFTATATNTCGTSSVSTQIFVNANDIVTINDSICSGENYIFPDGTSQSNITTSLVDTSYFTNVNGCDSSMVVNLFVKPKFQFNQSVNICVGDSYTFPDGTTQTITTNLTHNSTLQTQLGCDSIITTVVYAKPVYSVKDTLSVCYGQSFTYPDGYQDTNITSEVSHTSYLQTIYGCDSIITITVTVDSLFNIDEFVQLCEGDDFVFPDGTIQTNITAPISHVNNLTSSKGCDSVVTTIISVNPVFLISENVNVCYGNDYLFPDSTIYSSVISDTSHTSIISSTMSCDTIITTNLFVQSAYTFAVYDTICRGDSYTFPDGFILTNIQGNFIHQSNLTTIYGCDSSITTLINVSYVDTSVQHIGMNLLISNASTGVTYQWIDCSTGQPIVGETNSIYEPQTNGSYAVIITNNYCSDTSACYLVEGLGIEENINALFELFPNPVKNNFNIRFSKPTENVIVKIYSINGKLLKTINVQQKSLISIDLESFENGTYIVELNTKSFKIHKKIIKIN